MNIAGLGMDIVETARIAEAIERFGDKFLHRIFCPEELTYCLSHQFPNPHLAARFAAKEAISKAFGTGIGDAMGWKDLEIVRAPSGVPQVVLHAGAAEQAKALGVEKVLVSLSHTETYGAATALLIARDSV